MDDTDSEEEEGGRLLERNQWPPFCAAATTSSSSTGSTAFSSISGGSAFDWAVPTTLVYQETVFKDTPTTAATARGSFAPKFAEARAQLDYSDAHYKNLALPRQKFQDVLLSRIVDHVQPAASTTSPFLIFTAGAAGAGKSYVLTHLYQRNLFPLLGDNQLVKIDPAMIQQELPEMAGYHEHWRQHATSSGNSGRSTGSSSVSTAALQVQGEASQMADVLFEHSLLNQLSMLVDGYFCAHAGSITLNWYQELFARIRRDYPQYRIVILYVSASESVLLQRAQIRAQKMGKAFTNEDEIRAEMEQVASTVEALQSWTDTTVEITNNDKEPLQLKPLFSKHDDNNDNVDVDNWEWFAQLWTDENKDQTKEDQEAPPPPPSPLLSTGSASNMICNMQGAFDDTKQHSSARSIWLQAYPNMCPRCAVACDGQCGMCIHSKHVCACEICKVVALK